MKLSSLLILTSLALLLFSFYRPVQGQTAVAYAIQIGNDGSAAWTVQQTWTNISASVGSLIELRSKVDSLISDAVRLIGRPMQAEEESFSLMSNYSGSYVVVEYRFVWLNFSQVGVSNMTIGDVFGVPNYFSRLYGDGQITMTYPSSYFVNSVSPPPEARVDSLQILRWPGTLDFNGQTRIVLVKSEPSFWNDAFTRNTVLALVGVMTVAVVGVSVGVYSTVRRRKSQSRFSLPVGSDGLSGTGSDEQKVVELVKSMGGRVRQSLITDSLRFSKAKTSQLLSGLEEKGSVKRYKQGRDKIVVFVRDAEDVKR